MTTKEADDKLRGIVARKVTEPLFLTDSDGAFQEVWEPSDTTKVNGETADSLARDVAKLKVTAKKHTEAAA